MKLTRYRIAGANLLLLTALAFRAHVVSAQPIVYASTNAVTGLGEVRVINADGTGDRLLPLALPEPGFPSFSKDGRFMAITSQSPGRPAQSTKNVFLLNLLTSQLSKVTPLEDRVTGDDFTYYLPWYHALSPDSGSIAVWNFVRNLHGTTPILQIYRTSDGFLLNTLIANRVRTGLTQGGDGVDWHATQNLLVYALDTDIPVFDLDSGMPAGYNTEGTALWVGPTNQGPLRQLSFPIGFARNTITQYFATGGADYAPAFSPNGQQVAYVRANWIQDSLALGFRKPSVLTLRIVNLDGSDDHQVLQLNQGTYVMHLSWSRDGTQLVFDSGNQLLVNGAPANLADQTDALWIVNTNGTGLRNVRGPFAALPAWSPPGTTFCNLGVTAGGGAAGTIDDCGPPLNPQGTRTASGQYRLDITGGTPNLLYRVLGSTNLETWQTLGTIVRTNNTTSFIDADATSLLGRFYRVVLGR